MTMQEIVELVRDWDGVFVLTPGPGDGPPEVAWGDSFFYYAPDGKMPTRTQPFATIVTKNYPGDELSGLDRDGVYRVNIHPSRASFEHWAARAGDDLSVLDRIIVHPVYGQLGWVAVLNPGPETAETARELLREAYEQARIRYERRH
ncbi:MAG TPA: DUF6194 family protein [Glaciibacter sp.]|nr:DUF6194 family protein [Glaciibacter sp.]